ncbi:MAG: hypothetical protein GYB49_07695 [Alphaproteobacteria bacterium]|nr:hypothetical protein [Hyphomonas sp.]MBR9807086.1 hypothetical protein [Alphaproteobacteria bacterium]|tara:strand:+ start:814 stop:1284 length:471 start_codon:yes stop_codon:yes gene_type:complete
MILIGKKSQMHANDHVTATAVSIETLLALLLDEVTSTATQEQLEMFLASVGRRLAALDPLTGLSDVEEIESAVNALWQELGWGHVIFELDDGGIDIMHRNPPTSAGQEGGIPWDMIMPPLLQGAYAAWFHALSGNDALRTSITKCEPGLIELRHAP